MNSGRVERLLGVSAGVPSLSCHINAVGGVEHRLGLRAEERAPALPAVFPVLSDHMQGTDICFSNRVSGSNTYMHIDATLWEENISM